MKIVELLDDNAHAAIVALDLINKLSPFFIVEELEGHSGRVFRINDKEITSSSEVTDILISENAVELVKGLCFVLCGTISALLCNGRSPADYFCSLRESLDKVVAAGTTLDMTTQYDVLDILEATEGSSSVFYLKAYGLLNKPLGTYHASVGLASLFHSICIFDLEKDPREVADFMLNIIIDWVSNRGE